MTTELVPKVATLQDKLLDVEYELRQQFIDRDEPIRGLLLAALSGHHIEFLGPPGTAKSMIVRTFSSALNVPTFRWTLSQYTTPDEIFGPVDINKLKQGEYKRIPKGKLPEAHFAFLDEVYKASSAILNTLLTILEEHIWHNDGGETLVPLIFCAVASNEVPDTSEGLAALRDRFLLRYIVPYISEGLQFKELLNLRVLHTQTAKLSNSISLDELKLAQAQVKAMTFNQSATSALDNVWSKLRSEGIIVSDRRYVQILDLMAADAWLCNLSEVQADSVIVAEHALWQTPDQRVKVAQIVRSCVQSGLMEAKAIIETLKSTLGEMAQSVDWSEAELLQTYRQARTLIDKAKSDSPGKLAVNLLTQAESCTSGIMQALAETSMVNRLAIIKKLSIQLGGS